MIKMWTYMKVNFIMGLMSARVKHYLQQYISAAQTTHSKTPTKDN